MPILGSGARTLCGSVEKSMEASESQSASCRLSISCCGVETAGFGASSKRRASCCLAMVEVGAGGGV
jgi:hypothetical protein